MCCEHEEKRPQGGPVCRENRTWPTYATMRGMPWAPWDTGLFVHDGPVRTLIASGGWLAFAVYFYLCQRIGRENGYYLPFAGARDCAHTASDMGGVTAAEVWRSLTACFAADLFSGAVFRTHGVLTGAEVQRRYARYLSHCRAPAVRRDIWLLDAKESRRLCPDLTFTEDAPSFSAPGKGERGGVREGEKEEEGEEERKRKEKEKRKRPCFAGRTHTARRRVWPPQGGKRENGKTGRSPAAHNSTKARMLIKPRGGPAVHKSTKVRPALRKDQREKQKSGQKRQTKKTGRSPPFCLPSVTVRPRGRCADYSSAKYLMVLTIWLV